jgi:hypothetical protein
MIIHFYRLALKVCAKAMQTLIPRLSATDLELCHNKLEQIDLLAEDRLRKLAHPLAPVRGYVNTGASKLEVLVQPDDPPWKDRQSITKFSIPGMLDDEEIAYYHYVCAFYTGIGAVVELGPWLGLSTHHLLDALGTNPAFKGRRMHIFDDFIWRSDWMDRHYHQSNPPAHHADFFPLFMQFAEDITENISVHKAKINDYDGNESLPKIAWRGEPIEMMIVDCGRTIQVNQAWFDVFASNFIANKTLVIMQDWRLHRERPRRWYNQTNYFTAQNSSLELIHEISNGGIATFIYRG